MSSICIDKGKKLVRIMYAALSSSSMSATTYRHHKICLLKEVMKERERETEWRNLEHNFIIEKIRIYRMNYGAS